MSSGRSYQIKLDFKDFAGYGIARVDIGFANGLNSNGNGPNLTQPVQAFVAGYSSSSFTTKVRNITASTTVNVNLVIRIRWAISTFCRYCQLYQKYIPLCQQPITYSDGY